MLKKMQRVIEHLVVNKENMMRNLELSGGMIFSQGLLLKLIQKGLTREDGYKLVQVAAKKVWDEKKTLKEVVLKDRDIGKYLRKKDIEEAFDYNYHLKNVDKILKRVGINGVVTKKLKKKTKKSKVKK